ncbi:sulfite exporter TauE/SafE family protein [Plantactinospora endophytica]|uniref:Probable membrane transporter protein n=1 Tax=Plantactinospora endophytica TaxID=673535 RepID=A0ABQ4E677_9ACTN|nr:sulfite exporter TauE/SafE family protein [Plantactinospora endophytica]GIG90225.1 UPF0721 transmembrane protein [Plantactinospora endophytica]
MEVPEALLLLAAGLAAGMVNAVAGGGSLITFPAMIAVGLPPIAANVSNSMAVCPGYLASVLGSRADLPDRRWLLRLVPGTVLGTAAGCALLLSTPARAFELVVPFLVLGATAVLAFQEQLRRLVRQQDGGSSGPLRPGLAGNGTAVRSPARQTVGLHAMIVVGAVYGGYFGAALGVMLVAGLALVLDETLTRVSAIKNLLSAVVGLTTIVAFAAFGPVNWTAVAVVAPATIVGGYAGARLVRRLPPEVLRTVIVVFGTAIGLLLLYRAWT